MWGSSGNEGQDMRRPGPHQGMSVHVHTLMDMDQFCHRLIPPFFTEAVNLWSRVASLLTPWCAKGEVPTGVNLNRYAGDGSFIFIPWHCDNERLFGSPFEPKVIVSMSLGHSVLSKLRRRTPEKTLSQIWLDHGDLLVMDGLTQYEYEHSTASELEGPRVDLTYRWISQHIRSCPLAGLIGSALPSDAQDSAEPHSRSGGRGNQNVHDLFNGPPGCTRYMLSPKVCI